MNQLQRVTTALLISTLALLIQGDIQAQVTIGGNTLPEEYAILQLEGIGGLRLPKMTKEGRDNNLTPKLDALAVGLMIYNETDECIEFWDNSTWIPLKKIPALSNSKNGIIGDGDNTPFKLGGSITDGVTINQGNNNLFFDESTGHFSIANNSAFVVKSSGVGIGTNSPNAVLDITAPTGTGLRYNNDTPPSDGYALTSDKDGNARWEDIRIDPTRATASIVNGTQISSTKNNDPQKISNDLALSKGLWLISARYVAVSGNKASSLGHNAWLRLREVGNSTDEICVGMVPQHWNDLLTATPQFSFIIKVPKAGKTYALYGNVYQTSILQKNQMNITTDDTNYGKPYFYAVRLSETIY